MAGNIPLNDPRILRIVARVGTQKAEIMEANRRIRRLRTEISSAESRIDSAKASMETTFSALRFHGYGEIVDALKEWEP